MWIVPKSLFQSLSGAPDMVASEWDSSELSEICAQSLMRRSNFIAAKSWRRVWKAGKSTLPRYGLILKPSPANNSKGWLAAWLRATLANRFQQLATDKAPKTKKAATCGLTYKGQLQLSDLDSSFARTSQDTLPLGLKTSCTTFLNWTTKLRADCSRRERRACRTRGNACSSWPTIRAQEPGWTSDGYGDNLVKRMAKTCHPPAQGSSNFGGNPQECWPTTTVGDSSNAANKTAKRKNKDSKHHSGTTLVDAMRNWATPRACMPDNLNEDAVINENQRVVRKSGKDFALNLQDQVKRNWATPQASDHVEGARTAPESKQKCLGRDLNTAESARPTPRETASRDSGTDRGKSNLGEVVQHNTGMKLSPRWVEVLMGLPVGWLNPTCLRPIAPWEVVATQEQMNLGPPAME